MNAIISKGPRRFKVFEVFQGWTETVVTSLSIISSHRRYDGGNSDDVESTTRVAGTGARTPPTTSAAFLLATAAVTTSNVLMAATFLLPRVNALGAILIGGQQMWDRSVNGR